MANEATERVLESRIQLRNDTAEDWAAVKPSSRCSSKKRVTSPTKNGNTKR